MNRKLQRTRASTLGRISSVLLIAASFAALFSGLICCLVHAEECEHRELTIESQAKWECMRPFRNEEPTIPVLYFVPGPRPGSEPPEPGPVELPCFDFVMYVKIVSNRLEHLGNLTESGYPCLEDVTDEEFTLYHLTDVLYKGVVLPVEDPVTGETFVGVQIHNDEMQPGDQFTPEKASYVMRHLRDTFNEYEIGQLRYWPVDDEPRARLREWIADPDIILDFPVFLGDAPHAYRRGDTNDDDIVNLSDAITLLKYLFGPRPARLSPCADAFDVNDNGTLNVSDAVYLLYHLYIDARPVPAPFDQKGFDRTPDDLPPCGEA